MTSINSIANFSTKMLVELYNAWANKTGAAIIKKFSDRATAEKRINAICEEFGYDKLMKLVQKSNPQATKEEPKATKKVEPQPKATVKVEKAAPAPKKAKEEPKEEPKAKATRLDKADLLAYLQKIAKGKEKDHAAEDVAEGLGFKTSTVITAAKKLMTAGLLDMTDDRTPQQIEDGEDPFFILTLNTAGMKFDPKSQEPSEGSKAPGRPSAFSGKKLHPTKAGKEYPRHDTHKDQPSIRLRCWNIILANPDCMYEDYLEQGGTRFDLNVFVKMGHVTLK